MIFSSYRLGSKAILLLHIEAGNLILVILPSMQRLGKLIQAKGGKCPVSHRQIPAHVANTHTHTRAYTHAYLLSFAVVLFLVPGLFRRRSEFLFSSTLV